MSDEQEAPEKPEPPAAEIRIDVTDALIAYARFAGLKPGQIAKVVNRTPPTITQRLKVKASFFAQFQRFAAGIEAVYHTVGGDDGGGDPDLWQEGKFLAEQALLSKESREMLPEGRLSVE